MLIGAKVEKIPNVRPTKIILILTFFVFEKFSIFTKLSQNEIIPKIGAIKK